MRDEEELTRYIGLYHEHVYRLALSFVRNTAEAEDICQETFIRLLDYTGSFDAPENCKAWLMRVAANLSKNYLKSSRFTRNTELDDNIREEVASDYGDLYDAVMALPIKYRSIIHLYYFEGYSVKEITRILKITETTATTRLKRARDKLRYLLSGEEEHYEKPLHGNV